jgi:transposase InsO family protein
MRLHRNAKLGLAGRLALVSAVERGMSLKAAAAAFSVSPATAHRWWHRWQGAGEEARRTLRCLIDRSSRPHRSPRRLAPALEERICACRRATGWGPRLVAGATGFAHSTVWKVLKRAGISRPPRPSREPTKIDADHTTRVLDQIVRECGAGPELVRMDNGPEMTANALRDWCRFSGAERSFIEPGSPWQNPFVESFGSRVRDEVLSVEAFDSVLEPQTVINDWKDIYNHQRPHSSLGWRTPAAFAATVTEGAQHTTDP